MEFGIQDTLKFLAGIYGLFLINDTLPFARVFFLGGGHGMSAYFICKMRAGGLSKKAKNCV